MKTMIALFRKYNEIYNKTHTGTSKYFYIRFFYDESGSVCEAINDTEIFSFYNFAHFRKQIKKAIKEMENV